MVLFYLSYTYILMVVVWVTRWISKHVSYTLLVREWRYDIILFILYIFFMFVGSFR